jgi:anti-anti-sigma factor
MLIVSVENSGGAVILHCHGRIVRGEETAMLCAAAGQNSRNIILDLEDVEALDAAGIGAFIALQAAGIYLQLRNPHGQVLEALKVTRLNSLFDISESASGPAAQESRLAIGAD